MSSNCLIIQQRVNAVHSGVRSVVINDMLPAATEAARMNVIRNGVDLSRLVISITNKLLIGMNAAQGGS